MRESNSLNNGVKKGLRILADSKIKTLAFPKYQSSKILNNSLANSLIRPLPTLSPKSKPVFKK